MTVLLQTVDQILRLDISGLSELSLPAIFLIIFFTTFVTEDGACLAAGALAGQGRISFIFALSACFAGIFVGDIGLYWIGRIFGDSIAKTRIFRRFVSPQRIKRAGVWLEKRGPMAIVISRFVSGLRLPTYLAAGFLRTNFKIFAFYFFVATAIWTPILVGSAAFSQRIISPQYLLLSILVLFVGFRLIFSLSTWKKRRLFVGRLKRIRHWEFWSIKIFYFPVVIYVLWLGVKYRSLTVFTCANPAIEGGGFIGESKNDIYSALSKSPEVEEFLLASAFLRGDSILKEKISIAAKFVEENQLEYPLVLKPDVGERGADVQIIVSFEALEEALEEAQTNTVLQEYASGEEVSIFYFRYPSKSNGAIFSITEKEFPTLVGDGKRNVEELILRDDRAVILARKYFDQNADSLENIPEDGDGFRIIDIGTHSRGAIFKEGDWLKTPELESIIDKICVDFQGFFFGRFDIRADSFESLAKGTGFKIIELNGVTSESTNIYDKRYSLFDAYRILFRQWRIAFEIGAENKSLGARQSSVLELVRLFFRRESRSTS